MDESASAHADPPAGAPALPRSAAGLRLDAWRERGADRMDPVRFRFMEALERRAAPHAGAARALLDQRLAALLDAYAADLEQDEARPAAPRPSRRKRAGREAQDCAAADTPIDAPCPPTPLASLARALDTGHAVPRRGAYPELPLLDVYRDIWARSVPTASCANRNKQVPDNAGPLNSNNLVHRSLALMRQLARLSAPVPVLPGRAGLDGAVRWRGGRCQGSRARSAKAGAKGAGKAAKPAAAKRSRAKTA